ncbi:hypothetical protein [Natranaeroarchaeum aerophilus]|uniref:Uncharacterized protein n=1 Tax=Natranaeroarchaeum aerophilus TaxID=2917711 RepID=A0AAE3K452_9EURY|nr:hypothetical protein [Natranaeroarchaeum aerophilus]MCL9812861.1 hypothetical protein [Natranaeroarchaeum aerophilus]
MTLPSRRQVLAASTTALLAGCLDPPAGDSASENGEEPEDEYREPDDCEIEYGEWTGQAEPIETTVVVEESEDPEQDCAGAAASAAFDALNDKTELELDDASWAGFESSLSADGYRAGIVISKRVDTLRDRLLSCPDPEFDEVDARYEVPSEVSVTLEYGPDAETVTCLHEIEYIVRRMALE